MNRMRLLALAVITSAAVAGCVDASPGPNDTGTRGPGIEAPAKAADAAVGAVLRPSTAKGGTLRFGLAGDWDSVDPGDTYDTASWNFLRNYARTLVVSRAVPGQRRQLVPDLATSLGVASDDDKTWTYTLRSGIRFEDGSPITSKDIKYAVARSLDKRTLPNGPTFFGDYLAGVPAGYSVYRGDRLDDLISIETPTPKTIVFHLNTSVPGFDYFAQLPSTAPVPAAKDTGARYRQNVISSGPYRFTDYDAGQRYELGRNPNYDPLSDPASGRAALPNAITVELGLTASAVDARLRSGDLDVDLAGEGVQKSTRVALLGSSTLKANTDSAPTPSTQLTAINSSIAPLDNLDCRRAVVLADDKTNYLAAAGGQSEGRVATSLLPPSLTGQQQGADNRVDDHARGDLAGARAALKRCGRPGGFSTNLAYRAERPGEKAAAESLRRSLGRVGIVLTVKAYPSSDFNRRYAGNAAYARANSIGLVVHGARAGWPDGVDLLSQVIDSRAVRDSNSVESAGDGGGTADATLPDAAALMTAPVTQSDSGPGSQLWASADRLVTRRAGVIPGVWGNPLLYRPATLTNVFVNEAFNQYDYVALGTSRR